MTTKSKVTLGEGEYTYEMTGKDWGNIPESWSYKEATAVAVDSKDNVYVFNRGPNHPMIVFNSEGDIIRTWGDGVFTSPHGVTLGPDDMVYCVDNSDHTVRKFTPEGELQMTLGEKDMPSPPMSGKPFRGPTHLAVDPTDGDLYISDGYGNASVHRFSSEGKYISSWGESGTDEGRFNIVHNIAMDSDGYIYIADRENHRVQIFDTSGNFQAQWVNMSKAAAICIDHRNNDIAYVGEYFAGIANNKTGTDLGPRVSILEKSGKLLARVGRESYGDEPGRFYAPHGIAVDSRGDIYVAEVSWAEFGRKMEPPQVLRSLQKLVKKG